MEQYYKLDKIKELADIFQLDLNRKIFDLSMGNKKKVTIMQSLIHEPELLILDEPTNGVDPISRRDFWTILYQLVKEGI